VNPYAVDSVASAEVDRLPSPRSAMVSLVLSTFGILAIAGGIIFLGITAKDRTGAGVAILLAGFQCASAGLALGIVSLREHGPTLTARLGALLGGIILAVEIAFLSYEIANP
jgi:hypothetical protein